MREPTDLQLRSLYRQCNWLTNVAFQPVYIVRMDERTANLFILAGREETIEFEIKPTGEIRDE